MNSKPLRVGITGGIGSGKSMIARILKILKIPVYDADSRAKWLMLHEPSVKSKVSALFGEQAYQDNQLNRAEIARQVFNQEDLLNQLNAIVHPAVAKDFNQWCEIQDSKIVAKEAALLFETGSYQTLDQTWLVTCPEEIRIKRVLQRDSQRSKDEVLAIMAKQWPEKDKKPLASFEISNDDRQLVLPQVFAAVNSLAS